MSLGLVPLVLFLLYASIQDARTLTIHRYTLVLWGGVAVIGWTLGAWPIVWIQALACYGVLWLAGVGRGDRYGGLLIGGLLPGYPSLALCIGLTLACLYYRRTGQPPHAVPLYPFLSVGVAVMICLQAYL
jgi:hypothetical protein